MSNELKFKMWCGHYNKKINSTLTPRQVTYESWIAYEDMKLKAPSSVQNAIFEVNTTDFDLTCNYAVVQWANLKTNSVFLRYYFIADVTVGIGNVVTIQLSEDYLGSFKSSIYSLGSAYVLRTNAPNYYDIHLKDDMATHNDVVNTSKTFLKFNSNFGTAFSGQQNGSKDGYNSGCVIFVTSGGTTANSDVSFNTTGHVYGCNPITFGRLMANANNKGDIGTSGSGLLKALFNDCDTEVKPLAEAYFNPCNYLLSAIWLPFPVVETETADVMNSDQVGDRPAIGGDSASATTLQVGGTTWYHQANAVDGKVFSIERKTIEFDYAIAPAENWYPAGELRRMKFKYYTTPSGSGVPTLAEKTIYATCVDGWEYNSWRDRSAEWSQYQIYLPALGMTELPAEYAGTPLRINYRLDVITGTCDVKYILQDGTEVGWQRGNLGVDLQITSTTYNYNSYLNANSASANASIVQQQGKSTLEYTQQKGQIAMNQANLSGLSGAIGTIGTMTNPVSWLNPVGTLLNAGASTLDSYNNYTTTADNSRNENQYTAQQAKLNYKSALVSKGIAQASLDYDNMNPSLNTVGSAGNKTTLIFNNYPFVSVRKFEVKEDLSSHFGYPSCKYYNINDIIENTAKPFYIEISDSGIAIDAPRSEKEVITEMLASGIWIEGD